MSSMSDQKNKTKNTTLRPSTKALSDNDEKRAEMR